MKLNYTRTVLVFATERKNNVDPCLRSQKKVNNIQLFFTKLTAVHLMCQIFMNDLQKKFTEQGQQRSRVIRQIIDTAQRSLANRNQIQITIRSQ